MKNRKPRLLPDNVVNPIVQTSNRRAIHAELNRHEYLMNFDLKPIQIQFLQKFVRNHFKIQKTCEAIEISLMTYNNWKNSNPDFKKAVEFCMESELDIFEDALRDLVEERNPQAVLFGLRTRGKDRGYGEKQELASGIAAINITFEKAEDPNIILNDEEVTDKH